MVEPGPAGRSARPSRPRLLLVGAGHAHLHLVDHAADLAPCYDLTLVAPRWFHYSGTASAVATGDLPPSAGRIDVADLARRRAVRHLEDRVLDLDVAASTARTGDGSELGFDLVSLNLGSVVDPTLLPGHADGSGGTRATVVGVKPLPDLAVLREAAGRRVTIVGAGFSGVELAAHAAAVGAVVTLVGVLTPDLPAGARRRLHQVLAARGVEVREHEEVRRVEVDRVHVHTAEGDEIPHDLAVLATGLVAPPEVARWGLGDGRGVPVTGTLTHPDHDHVLAAGDCAHFLPQPLSHLGVHGVRQGPVLLAGLLARAADREPPTYEPPPHPLSVLDLGRGRGLAVRGRSWWEGRAALLLKRRIDRRWLARYAGSPGPTRSTGSGSGSDSA